MPRWFVAVCWVMAVLFSLSVGLQENDPDPIRWMLIYGAAALCAAALPYRREAAIPSFAVGLFAAAWGAYLTKEILGIVHFTDLWLKMSEKGGAVEVGREAGGLIIIALFLIPGGAFRWSRP